MFESFKIVTLNINVITILISIIIIILASLFISAVALILTIYSKNVYNYIKRRNNSSILFNTNI